MIDANTTPGEALGTHVASVRRTLDTAATLESQATHQSGGPAGDQRQGQDAPRDATPR